MIPKSLHTKAARLIVAAKKKHGLIWPCKDQKGKYKTIPESFTVYNNKLIFWFNIANDSTHCEITLIKAEEEK